ncbi:hypothetical protein [Collimonas sp.]|uniref:hypothetical protein n=1 Tax=Collimonas sp. TaxID=1963772 RepID=UPI002BC101C6|nr:hypothetical protein [Collimonas sp.]HWX02433.1 hypothetical protein [Collimonas sp.]
MPCTLALKSSSLTRSDPHVKFQAGIDWLEDENIIIDLNVVTHISKLYLRLGSLDLRFPDANGAINGSIKVGLQTTGGQDPRISQAGFSTMEAGWMTSENDMRHAAVPDGGTISLTHYQTP